ncbi:hypothetical protein [Neorhizobium alkalisoli]|uniref:hypothetical protein n=1 Tax=Neorhizobium alkalisoli TaxID=528178 RepID=UPI000CF91341|nr:hypothetical protein [Neorhizobium alkalisoli]
MIRLLVVVLLFLAVPLVLKERAGGLRDLASTSWREGVANAQVLSALRAAGMSVEVGPNGSEGTAAAAGCEVELRPADPQGQTLGYLIEFSKEFDRLSFLYKGGLHDEFPYLNALTRHILFILLNSVGIENDYRPVIGVFQRGACGNLDQLRQI